MKSLRVLKYYNRRKNYRVPIPLDNWVDKDLQSMLFPLNLMQNVLLCPKYRIKNNSIYPNNLAVKLLGLFGVIIAISLFLYRAYQLFLDKTIKKYIKLTFINSVLDVLLYSFGFTINYIINVLQTKRNISFVLKFQDVHRFLNKKRNFNRFIIRNWICIFCVLGFNIFVVTYFYIKLHLANFYLFCGIVILCFDVNIINAIRIIKLLSEKVKLWNLQAVNCQKTGHRGSDYYYCNKMFEAYVTILECYDIYKSTYQQMIVFHTIEFFYHSLIKLQISLKVFKIASFGGPGASLAAWLSITFFYIWVIKSFILEIILSSSCEKFHIQMDNVQHSCALILKSNCTDAEKKLCKNIMRLHEATFEKMDACRMFYVDASFPLKMLVLHSNYTIVLLQFAFLT